MIEIRKAVADDAEQMVSVAEMMAHESDYAADGFNPQRMSDQIHAACVGTGNTFILVAEDAGRAVGAVMYSVTAPWFADYPILVDQAVYVVPDYRKSGVNQALIKALVAEGRAAGARRIHIGGSADIDNQAAYKSFTTAGFEAVGTNYRMRI